MIDRVNLKTHIALGAKIIGLTKAAYALNRVRMPYIIAVNYHRSPAQHEADLERQIRYFSGCYENITADSLDTFFRKEANYTRPGLILCFDDGFEDNYDVAARILDKYGLKAWFFIVPEWAQLRSTNQYEQTAGENASRYMSWSQIIDLRKRGHEIGCHTYSHLAVSSLNTQEKILEMLGSKEIIESQLNEEIVSFCFPIGDSSSFDLESVCLLKGKYRFAFTSCPRIVKPSHSPIAIGRNNIEANWDLELVKFILSGSYNLKYLYRNFLYRRVLRAAEQAT